MPGGEIKFDDSTQEFGAPPTRPQGADIAGMIISWGLAKDRQQAQTIMVVIVGLALLGAAYFMFFSGGASDVPTTPVYN